MNTDTHTSIVTRFIEGKYAKLLGNVIENIRDNTAHYTEVFISEDQKFNGMPKSVLPLSRHIRTGFEYIEGMIIDGQYVLIDDTLVISYIRANVGEAFSTNYFRDELKPLYSSYIICSRQRMHLT